MTQSKEVKGTVNTNKYDFELTALERILYEAHMDCCNRCDNYSELYFDLKINFEDYLKYNRLAIDESIKDHFLKEIISKAGLTEKFQAFYNACKKQEA